MPFSQNNVQSISSWFPILNWEKLPNLGHCYTHTERDKFLNDYYVNRQLTTLYLNICETISNERNSANIRITGDPGAGKSSFLYALKNMAEEGDDKLKSFYFYIFKINKVDDVDTINQYTSEIIFNIKRAWKSFYKSNNLQDIYTRFKQQKLSQKDLINKLSEYYKDNVDEFNKVLVFVIDEVDLLPGSHVATVADCIIRNIEEPSVKKWLVLREVTYQNYSGQTKNRIEQFFPDPYSFPTISLHELVCHRISKSSSLTRIPNEYAKNPFSKMLCDEKIKPVCEGNLREALSLLKTLLEENLPKKIQLNSSEEFIQKYIDTVAINTFLRSQKIINLHADIFRVALYPLAIDILGCARYHSSEGIIFGALNDCVNERDKSIGHKISGSDENLEIKIRTGDYKIVIERLVGHGLLHIDNKKKTAAITPKGVILSKFSATEHYYDYCKSKTIIKDDDEIYWGLADKKINYERKVSVYITWKSRNLP